MTNRRPIQSAIRNPQSAIRVACFTPLSPVPSGVSFYSEELLPVLARALDVEVFVDGYRPTLASKLGAAGVRVRDAREFERASRRRPYDATIYQLGNSPAHAYMYDRALRRPGIVVLHEVVLHHLQLWMAVNRGRRRQYTAALARLYGPPGEAVARAVLRGQTPPALFDFPLVEPILEAARLVIVHNEMGAERVRQLRPGTNVRVVPMGMALPRLPSRDEARARLGVAPGAFLVVSHGHATPYKRLDVALRAFRRLLAWRPDARFLIAGSEAPNLGLGRLIDLLGLRGRAGRLGFVPAATVADLLAAADCCVNLRHPSAGETSASLLRIMGAGLPALVSDAGSFRELPDSCCVKIPVGRLEEPMLAEFLIELARNAPLRAALGARARAFVAGEHSPERSARGYLDALGALTGRTLTLPEAPPGPAETGGEEAASVVDVQPAGGLQTTPLRDWGGRGGGPPADPLLDGVADALAELRLVGHAGLERSIARDLVALGLGAGEGAESGGGGEGSRGAGCQRAGSSPKRGLDLHQD